MASANIKDIGNALYNGALMAVGVIATRMGLKAMGFKDRPLDMKPASVGMLAGEIGVANYAVQKLKDAKVLPATIFT